MCSSIGIKPCNVPSCWMEQSIETLFLRSNLEHQAFKVLKVFVWLFKNNVSGIKVKKSKQVCPVSTLACGWSTCIVTGTAMVEIQPQPQVHEPPCWSKPKVPSNPTSHSGELGGHTAGYEYTILPMILSSSNCLCKPSWLIAKSRSLLHEFFSFPFENYIN